MVRRYFPGDWRRDNLKRFIVILLISLVMALATVLVALHYRRNPARTGTDAYLPIRTLSPTEAAVLLREEKSRDSDSLIGTAVESIEGPWVTILTTRYVVEIPENRQRVSERFGDVVYQGKKYAVIDNSWEDYCCRYRLKRIELEAVLGKPISITPPAEINNSRLSPAKVSFSSVKIPFYVVAETLAIALILLALYYLFTRGHFLLWLPALAAISLLLFVLVMIYSPAFVDADWFHQRIILEQGSLGFFVFLGFPGCLHLIAISLFAYVAYRIGRGLIRKKMITLKRYLCLLGGIIGLAIGALLLIIGRQYRAITKDAYDVIGAARLNLNAEALQRIRTDPALPGAESYVNFVKEGGLRPETMVLIKKIMDSRVKGQAVLHVLIPSGDRYLFIWGNDHFNYIDLRKLDNIIDYEFIQTAISSKESYRTPFWLYILNTTIILKFEGNSYIAVEVILDRQGEILSVIIVKPDINA